jgi:hypothetical protein
MLGDGCSKICETMKGISISRDQFSITCFWTWVTRDISPTELWFGDEAESVIVPRLWLGGSFISVRSPRSF